MRTYAQEDDDDYRFLGALFKKDFQKKTLKDSLQQKKQLYYFHHFFISLNISNISKMLGVMLLLVMLSCHNWILNVLMRLLSLPLTLGYNIYICMYPVYPPIIHTNYYL